MKPPPFAGSAHLIGSVPLADAETVFRTLAAAIGPTLSRMPDGETGQRRRWIFFQSVTTTGTATARASRPRADS